MISIPVAQAEQSGLCTARNWTPCHLTPPRNQVRLRLSQCTQHLTHGRRVRSRRHVVGLAVVVGVAKTQSEAGASIPLGALAHHRDERQAGALAAAVALDAVLVVELPSLFFHSDLDGPRVWEDFIIAHQATVCGFRRKVGLELVEVGPSTSTPMAK